MSKQENSDLFNIKKKENQYVLCLAGNPNTGKSSIFNQLTKLKQHTGNWPGKTISNARGNFSIEKYDFILVDVPGTYSLFGLSDDEIVARDFICFGNSDIILVVTDATCLERNLNLLFQVLEYNKKVILIVNLMDEARKKEIEINKLKLCYKLGIPIVFTSAKTKEGIDELKRTIISVIENKFDYQPIQIKYNDEIENKLLNLDNKINNTLCYKRTLCLRILDGNESFTNSLKKYGDIDTYNEYIENDKISPLDKEGIREEIISTNYAVAENITKSVITKKDTTLRDRKIDKILTSRIWGIPIMILLLGFILYLTIQFANYPSQLLSNLLFKLEDLLVTFFNFIRCPTFITNFLILGVYRTVAWVTSVMLPPMAIFFPLFTLLEDLGYLPRIAYNLDYCFKKSCAHGKQCLSMCMGLGCNAAGVTGARIIDSPREKLIAILTNTFVPCNGRFPTIITIACTFFAITKNSFMNTLIPTIIVTLMICLGVIVTLIVSKLLSKTILKGEPSSFTLELPPYRKPNILRIIYTSFIDRTIFLLGRAVKVAAPFGGLIWVLANININNISILSYLANFFNPLGNLLGLDGVIVLAFLLALPANEILLPIIIMAYLAKGELTNFESIDSLRIILMDNGWTILTAINLLLFSLLHWPCSTTLLTIKRETGSLKYTIISFLIPTIIAITICIITTQIYYLII